jgi:hypothetical protein
MLNLDTTQLQKLSFNQYLTQGVATGQKNHFDQLPIGHNLLYVFGQHKHTAKKSLPVKKYLDQNSSPLGYPTFHLWQARYQWFYAANIKIKSIN